MAIDTRKKRLSMLNFGDGAGIHLLHDPDGTVDQGDRQTLLDCYSGIAFGAPPTPGPAAQNRHRRLLRLLGGYRQ